MKSRTDRQRVKRILRLRNGVTPTSICNLIDERDIGVVLSHVEHINESLENSEEHVVVAPAECKECGFNGYDDKLNIPTSCPECNSEWIREPRYSIEELE